MSLGLKKTLTSTNIRVGFKGTRIWPLNFEAMKSKVDPSEGFVPQCIVDIRLEEELNEAIIEEGIPPPSPNATHYYVDSGEENGIGDDEDVAEDLSTHDNISNFFRMPQEVVTVKNPRLESLIDYSQSHILTSTNHVDILHIIAEKKAICTRKRSKEDGERAYQACKSC